MTMREYEERFQPPMPPLYQTLVAAYGPSRDDGAVYAFGLPRPWSV